MKKIALLVAALAFAAAASGQNLNPEVQVTNAYESETFSVAKPGLPMALPDSLTRFDYHFDYAVFDTPYKGAYEFSPYQMQMNPEARVPEGRTLLVKAGAGYTFHPELDIIWAPLQKGRWSLVAFENLSGYSGRYFAKPGTDAGPFTAYDLMNRAGVDARFSLPQMEIKLEGGYDGIFADEPAFARAFNSLYARTRLKSSTDLSRNVLVDVGAEYRFVADNAFFDHILRADGKIAPRISDKFRARLDFDFCLTSFYTGFGVVPKVDAKLGPVSLSAGIRLGYAERFTIYPDVSASLYLWKDRLSVFASVRGRDVFYTYSDLKFLNHRYHQYYATYEGSDRPFIAREPIDITLGARGLFDFGLQYSLSGGFKLAQGAPLFRIEKYADTVVERLFTRREFGPSARELISNHIWYADLLLAWKNERIDLSGRFRLQTNDFGTEDPALAALVAPELWNAGLRATYNWRRRIFAGIDIAAASKRVVIGRNFDIPGYLDLGLHAEYRMDNRWTVWLKGANLLAMPVFRSPLYAEAAPAVTLGVTFQL